MWEVVIEPTRARCIFLRTDKEISQKVIFINLGPLLGNEERYWDYLTPYLKSYHKLIKLQLRNLDKNFRFKKSNKLQLQNID